MAIIELVLLLAVLILFIITDSRTIGFVAKHTLASTKFTYTSINGNLLKGLKVRNLSYNHHQLFRKATIHWNPLTLMYHKITLTKVDVQGLEIDSINKMIKQIDSESNQKNSFTLDYALSLNRVHVDINPYIFEGVKFSSFLLETDSFNIDRELHTNAKKLKLSFDSDIVKVDVKADIKESKLIIEKANLKQISSVAITKLVQHLKKTSSTESSKSSTFVPFKEIIVKHALGTLKPVRYGVLHLKGATLNLYNGSIDPFKHYTYKFKKLQLQGKTNFGKLSYKGLVKESTINAKGHIILDKRLFSKYHLPLNFKALRKLSSTLKLNHYGVWLGIDHKLKKLLFDNKAFNLDISKAHHKLSYIYGEDLEIESKIVGSTTYTDKMKIDAKTVIDFDKHLTTYTGEISLDKFKEPFPKETQYLFEGFKAKYKGEDKALKVTFDSNYLKGRFETKAYENAMLYLDSKEKNIELSKIVKGLKSPFNNEKFAFTTETYLDFYDREKSNTTLTVQSDLINLKGKGHLSMPMNIDAKVEIPKISRLRKLDNNFKFDYVKNFKINFKMDKKNINIKIDDWSNNMQMTILYDKLNKKLQQAHLLLGNEQIDFSEQNSKGLTLKTHVNKLQKFLKNLKYYYNFEVPSLKGEADIEIEKNSNGLISLMLKSKKLKYLDKNIYNILIDASMDRGENIILKKYHFNIDSNPYISKFYSNKPSYLSFKASKLHLKQLWINNQFLIKGFYDLAHKKGKIKIDTHAYNFSNNELNLQLGLDLTAKIAGTQLDIEGDVNILSGTIHYDIEGSDIVEDSDIIIVQEHSQKRDDLLKNMKLYLKIHSKQPLHYYGKNTEINFINELSVVKNFNQKMLITGMSTIKSGFYELEDKHFTVDESHLYFAGDVKKPLLDIKANYTKEQYIVNIFISGTTDEPIVNFNSDPYLTQQEILSLILFDGTGTSDGKGAEAYTLLGGTFAKGFMKSLGINIDHFLLGTDKNNQLSLEIGRKISNDVTLLYLNKDGLNGAKVRVEYSNKFETDIIVMPPNTSSIEFLYKNDH